MPDSQSYPEDIFSTFIEIFVCTRDVNVLIFLDFSFRYDSVHQKY